MEGEITKTTKKKELTVRKRKGEEETKTRKSCGKTKLNEQNEKKQKSKQKQKERNQTKRREQVNGGCHTRKLKFYTISDLNIIKIKCNVLSNVFEFNVLKITSTESKSIFDIISRIGTEHDLGNS